MRWAKPPHIGSWPTTIADPRPGYPRGLITRGYRCYNCIVDVAVLRRKLDEMFDQALLGHAFVDHSRDYGLDVCFPAVPAPGAAPTYRRYLFRYCVEATCRSALRVHTWRASLDDRLLDFPVGTARPAAAAHRRAAGSPRTDLDGYVWGVRWQCLYPGASMVAESATARRWSEAVGIDFHEVRVRTNVHDLTLVFSDLRVSELAAA